MRLVTVAATQMIGRGRAKANIEAAEKLVREAAASGANIILLQELFETSYFCQKPKEEHFSLAKPALGHPVLQRFSMLAKELGIVLPISFFERKNKAFFNSLAMIDADGEILGIYRKSHIPDGAGYQEKFYFSPGDTGFKVWRTAFGCVGAGICWDQWFPEAARIMALMGAEMLLYPTAIGSEPQNPLLDSKDHWQAAMLGHSAANMIPVIASNRIGTETEDESSITFYGSSFISDNRGQVLAQADRETETFVTASLDLDELAHDASAWGLFRDRRPDLYGRILTLDGHLPNE
jgi:N-carbamoylputrescine amidase